MLLSLLSLTGVFAMAQRASIIDTLLHQIEVLQIKTDDFYYAGSFPTYRQYGESLKLKEDNAVFFAGLIAFTIKEALPYLTPEQQIAGDTIIHRTIRSYSHNRNKDGLPTFNFWRTNPPLVFPNSWFLNLFDNTKNLPDDLDDTSIFWLSMDPSDSLTNLIKKLMDSHANGETAWIENTYKRYRKLRAYSTWFGVKMPIDFDFCVLCNVLYFVHAYGLPLDVHDSASVELLRRMIVEKEYLKHPAYISPHYGRTPLLIYHAARLLGQFSIPALDTLKPTLLKNAEIAYKHSNNWLDSVLLSTAIMRLGGSPEPLPDLNNGIGLHKTTFFVASFADIFPGFWKKMLLKNPLIKYYFSCPAFRYALYLENLVVRKKWSVASVTYGIRSGL